MPPTYHHRFRFIPAGAGNTSFFLRFQISSAVYPRWRGEHRSLLVQTPAANGLSPLARGTHFMRSDSPGPGRFIPAGAGNTGHKRHYLPAHPVYPRWRGEHSSMQRRSIRGSGLSPLARGTHESQSPSPFWRRFIPAGAGNTLHQSTPPARCPVYPRWRGEH